MKQYILALDQGTTSSRTLLVDHSGKILDTTQQEFTQHFPKPGWVEHDPLEILESQMNTIAELVHKQDISGKDISAIGITNQRETTIVWDKKTGKPVYNAIVWQDRRTADYCNDLSGTEWKVKIHEKTGLILDAYFSASKIKWILDNVEGCREKAENGELLFGTVDTWLIYKLTGGKTHATDVSNASRTMIFNIQSLQWDLELLSLFNIPLSMLPEVKSSKDDFGYATSDILGEEVFIGSAIGDQQSALFGQMCFDKGMMKNTYGTGCFLVLNTGTELKYSSHQLLSTIAWKIDDQVNYAMEGSVFVGGAVVQWLRDGLGLISSSGEVEELINSVEDNGGVYFVPALTGLGAPYWDSDARGSIYGLTRGTTKGHIAKAAVESIAFQVYDLVEAMNKDLGSDITALNVDGGASANNYLMQFQSDLINAKVLRPKSLETTALGASYLAGLSSGFWKSTNELVSLRTLEKTFTPSHERKEIAEQLNTWRKAVSRSLHWLKDEK
ncbi:MAG: glycerol kinase GlpK [Saprospiraceae bacterium]|nr:glycerol kinase GlpK [Bacteroidia bacterium]NNF22101.1 glycerol kinase GlpK [Saprospiraceae bacterium]